MGRRIKRARIKTISLVPRGHNNFPVLYKGATKEVIFNTLSKMSDMGEVTALVYAPETRDNEGDIADQEVVKGMAHSFLLSGEGVDILHDMKPVPKDQAYVAESFIIQKGDPRFEDFKDFNGKPVNPVGGWGVVIKINDPGLRELYKSGAWNGVSLCGPAELEIEKGPSPDAKVDRLLEAIVKALQTQNQTEDTSEDMKPEEMKALLDAQAASLTKGITDALTAALTKAPAASPAPATPPAPKAEEKPAEDAEPVFKGDITDVKALEAHRKALLRHQLAKSTDLKDPKAIENLIASLTKSADAPAAPSENDAKIAELERQLASLRKASSVPAGGGTPAPTTASIAKELADMANNRRKA